MKRALSLILLLATFSCIGSPTRVTRIIDGDTFVIQTGEKVRLIGINAPEISDLFGTEAKQYLAQLIENKIVDLQSDTQSNDRDRYQRLLRYVIIGNIDINQKMVTDGFAFAYLKYKFNRSEEYKKSQIVARANNSGIWNDSKSETIINQQNQKENSILEQLSLKDYFIGSLVLLLVLIGIHSYYRK